MYVACEVNLKRMNFFNMLTKNTRSYVHNIHIRAN